ncbi:MAG: FAD-dependent oxidoreductase, partial [Alphaproteobacteria bacterium]|nr:FAD-dependent oxidoreductase [Alphaproteobacteria bacterium]
MKGIPRSVGVYDDDFDVVVVGYGFAGCVSALEAARAGARVLLIEKTGVPGGISICSYGSVRCAMDAGKARSYLTATNGGRTPEDVTRTLADGMARLEPYVRDLARVNGAEIGTSVEAGKAGGNYPLPGFDTFYHTTVHAVPNFDARAVYPWANGAPGGPMLFKILDDNLANEDVAIRLNTRGLRLLTSEDGTEVRGITVEGRDGVRHVKARRGVILASGGFEGSAWRQDQFW